MNFWLHLEIYVLYVCAKSLPKTSKRHKLFNVNSKENAILCGYLLELCNLNHMIDVAQILSQTRDLLLACHSCTNLLKGISNAFPISHCFTLSHCLYQRIQYLVQFGLLKFCWPQTTLSNGSFKVKYIYKIIDYW